MARDSIVRAVAFCVVMMFSAHTAVAGIPVILDTDMGDDIDDTWALAMLLGHPELDTKLIVTASDNTEIKTRLLAKYLDQSGYTHIPIGQGIKNKDKSINQAAWIGDYSMEQYPGTVRKDGVQAMIDMIITAPEPITIIVIGPQTNLAAALERDPRIARKARVVMMAGSVHVGYNGSATPTAEWNVRRDPAAAQAVFAAPWEITMTPLDSCGTLRLKGEHYQAVADSRVYRTMALMENYAQWSNRGRYGEGESSILFDTVAIYLAHSDALCKMEMVNLRIDDEGNTLIDDENGRPVNCALGWQDDAAFEDVIVERLTTGR